MKNDLVGWNSADRLGARPIESVPSQPDDRYYGDENWQRKLHKSMTVHFATTASDRAPVFKVSPIITSNTLVKDTRLAEQWKYSSRHDSAVEMELGGIYTAAGCYGGSGNTRVLAIRGISDIVGYKRSPEWTAFACKTAASFTSALIATGLLD